jgi:NACalpha-BTF3-like transcription factor
MARESSEIDRDKLRLAVRKLGTATAQQRKALEEAEGGLARNGGQ